MRRRRWVGVFIGAVLLAAGVSACERGAAEEPDPLDTIEVGPESDSEPEHPEDESDDEPGPADYEHPVPAPEIDDEGQAGAEAAAVYFIELYSYVHATGDFDAWDLISADDCDFCSGVRASVTEHYESGGSTVTSPPTIVEVTSQVWPEDYGDFAVAVVTENEGFADYSADGDLIGEFPAESVRAWVLLELRGEWQVLGSEVESLE